MRKRAYLYARDMVWNKVAQSYMSTFVRARSDRMRTPRIAFSDLNAERALDRLPSVKLDHLYRMTDHSGLLQHAVFSVPNYREGYTTDDNARALIVAVLMDQVGLTAVSESAKLASCYLAFLWHAFNPATGRYRNFLSYERQWHEAEGSEVPMEVANAGSEHELMKVLDFPSCRRIGACRLAAQARGVLRDKKLVGL